MCRVSQMATLAGLRLLVHLTESSAKNKEMKYIKQSPNTLLTNTAEFHKFLVDKQKAELQKKRNCNDEFQKTEILKKKPNCQNLKCK